MWLESFKIGDVEFVDTVNVDLKESERLPDHPAIPIDIPSVSLSKRESIVIVKITDEYKHVNKFVDFFDENWNVYDKKYYSSDFDETGQIIIADHKIPRRSKVNIRVYLNDYQTHIEKEYWLSINLDLVSLPEPTIDSFIDIGIGDMSYKSLGDTDVSDQVINYLNGFSEVITAPIEYVTDKILYGLSVSLKEEFADYYISFMDTYDYTHEGEYGIYTDVYSERLLELFDDLMDEYAVPYENFNNLVIILTDVPLEDILENKIKPTDARIKAFGVKFVPGDNLEPDPLPDTVITDIESELFIKINGKWFRLVDKAN